MPKHHNLPKMLLTVDEAADVLAIGRTRLYELMNAGEIDYVMVGSSRRLTPDALALFVHRLGAEHHRVA